MNTALAIASLVLLFNIAAVGQQLQSYYEAVDDAKLISKVLASARLSASLEYNGKCSPNVPVPNLPPIREPQKPHAQNVADDLRYMFSVDSRLFLVSDERNGIIHIVEAGVETDILHVRIKHLSFDGISYADGALAKVIDAPEVQSFIQTKGIGQPPFNMFAAPVDPLPRLNHSPIPGVRSISGDLNDVTVADALDYILKTFPGFWLYQNCESLDEQRLVYFGLFPVPGRMWMWDNASTFVK